MREILRAGVILIAFYLVVTAIMACGSEREEKNSRTGAGEVAVEEPGASWQSFWRTAEGDLDAVTRQLEVIREDFSELERARADAWIARARAARQEVEREIALAPAKRERDQEELKRELEEIRREADVLLGSDRDEKRVAGSEESKDSGALEERSE